MVRAVISVPLAIKTFDFFSGRSANRLISIKGQTVSEAGLASTVAATTRSVLQAYWSWVYAREYLAVEHESLALTQGLLRDDRERAELGKIATVDVVEVEAEVALRSDVILSAAKNVAKAEDQLRLLIFAPLDSEQRLSLVPPPGLAEPDIPLGQPDEIIARALNLRQDLRILPAALDIDDITVKRLRNEVLPDVALSLSYAGLGFAGNQVRPSLVPGGLVTGSAPQGFVSALGDLARFRYPGWSAELSLNIPIVKSHAAAEAATAAVKRRQDETTLMSAEQQAVTEIKTFYRDVDANRQRLPLTANAVTFAERRLDAEQRKFLVGLSTSFLVIQAQRDLTATRERQLASVLDFRLVRCGPTGGRKNSGALMTAPVAVVVLRHGERRPTHIGHQLRVSSRSPTESVVGKNVRKQAGQTSCKQERRGLFLMHNIHHTESGVKASPVRFLSLGLAALVIACPSIGLAQTTPNGGSQQPALMDRDKEIALVLSSCPAAVAAKAAVYVLEKSGYVKVRDSQNGFTAIVFWLPGPNGPQCMDAEGSRTLLPRMLKVAEWRAQGKSREEIDRLVADAYSKGLFQAPTKPGIDYMLSTENTVRDDRGNTVPFPPHLMFYAPYLTNADIGSDGKATSSVFVAAEGTPQALIIVPLGGHAGRGHSSGEKP
jgi:outer membrane protein TolC